eukprot:CAMPEP_0114562162 /NCGR_PEP_ID=MMETSP0114-20121206/12378_1 /TAXON_ID=31324 /ORGANISM="Goniomonas sp, Strain m" /LENGTH=641 /DNA_ID=CAMNT_0001747821 /DNA_START=72 /DNA_END=1997 /DNA_ORIENTATION=+
MNTKLRPTASSPGKNGGVGGATGLRVDQFQQRNTPGNVGVAFSGGGSEALSLTMGRLRALRYLGLLDQVKAISSVSGGTWATVPYTYLPDSISDDDFLGPMVADQSTLHMDGLFNSDTSGQLNYLPKNNLGYVPTQPGMDIVALTASIPILLAQGIPSTRIWSHLIGNYVLEPFGLSAWDSQWCPTHSYCADSANCADIQAANPGLPLHQMRAGRPFHIMNTAMFIQANEESPSNPFSYEVGVHSTQYQMGIVSSPAATYIDNGQGVPVGGGTIPPHAFNSKITTLSSDGDITVSQPCPFGLSDITGASSAAPAELFKNEIPKWAKWTDAVGLDPVYSYFPVDGATVGSGTDAKFADGGTIDNTGVCAMLQYEDIDNIISFVYDATAISKDANGQVILNGNYPMLFGYQQYDPKTGQYPPYPAWTAHDTDNTLLTESRFNQVFDAAQFQEMLDGLYAASTNNGNSPVGSGAPVFLQQNVRVMDNSWWGVKGDRTVNVLWVYSDMATDWLDTLAPAVQADMALKPNFPHINFLLGIYLDATTVNELAHFASWIVNTKATLFRAMFDPAGPAAALEAANNGAGVDNNARPRGLRGVALAGLVVAVVALVVVAAAVAVVRRRRGAQRAAGEAVPMADLPYYRVE